MGSRRLTKDRIEALHADRFGYMSMLKTRFTLPHLVELYRRFDGDLALPIVLGEIAARNLQAVYQMRPEEPYEVLDRGVERAIVERRHTKEDFRPANTLSIANATGIPRETVRRKVEKLLQLGWIQRDARGHLFLTPKAGEDLGEFDRDETVRFALSAAAVVNLLDDE